MENKMFPRISVINCVSRALEMLRFSTEQLIENAGTDNFDYIIVCWQTTKEVDDYIYSLPSKFSQRYPKLKIHRIDHKTIPDIGYVPNLRAMINEGFEKGFELNEYCSLVNTDQAFYKNWLINLLKHCNPDIVIGSIAVLPRSINPKNYQADFGFCEYGKFDIEKWNEFCQKIIQPNKIISEDDYPREDYFLFAGFPYIFHRKMWEKAGPWELTLKNGTPDVNFFRRAHRHGFKFVLSLDSIAYHYEAGERRRDKKPPEFAKDMKYDPIPIWGYRIVIKVKFLKLLKKLGIIKKEPIY